MKGLNNDSLPEYVSLQNQIVHYLRSPSYANYYKNHDKKLTKNTVKRCVVEPFIDKFMKSPSQSSAGEMVNVLTVEIARFKDQPSVFEILNETLITLDESNMLSPSY